MEGVKKENNMKMEIDEKPVSVNKNTNDLKKGKNKMKARNKRKQEQNNRQNMNNNSRNQNTNNTNAPNKKNIKPPNKGIMKSNGNKTLSQPEGENTVKLELNADNVIKNENITKSHPKGNNLNVNAKTKNKVKKKKMSRSKGNIMKKEMKTGNENMSKLQPKEENVKMETEKTNNKVKKENVSKSQLKDNVKTDAQNRKKKRKRSNNSEFWVSSEKIELTPVLNQETDGRTSHRDERTLYVRFPPSLNNIRDKASIQPLVPSAADIRLPRLSPGCHAKFCYIEFKTTEETAKMLSKISSIKINGESFYADYVGKKSKVHSEKETRIVDSLRLYVGGLPRGIEFSDLKTAFPTAKRILFKKPNKKISVSVAYLLFETHKEALDVFNASKNLRLLGKEVIVMFATHKDKRNPSETPQVKKQKTMDVDQNSSEVNVRRQEMDEETDDSEGNMDVDSEPDEN